MGAAQLREAAVPLVKESIRATQTTARVTQRGVRVATEKVGDTTVGTLGSAGVWASDAQTLAGLVAPIPMLGPGAVVVTANSAQRMLSAKSGADRADAASSLATGLQGLSAAQWLPGVAAEGLARVLAPIGIAGGGLQGGLGAARLWRGRHGDRSQLAIGGLDLASGGLWVAGSLGFVTPTMFTASVAFTGARLAFEHRARLRSIFKLRPITPEQALRNAARERAEVAERAGAILLLPRL